MYETVKKEVVRFYIVFSLLSSSKQLLIFELAIYKYVNEPYRCKNTAEYGKHYIVVYRSKERVCLWSNFEWTIDQLTQNICLEQNIAARAKSSVLNELQISKAVSVMCAGHRIILVFRTWDYHWQMFTSFMWSHHDFLKSQTTLVC